MISFAFLLVVSIYYFFMGKSDAISVKIPIMVGFVKLNYITFNMQDAATLKAGTKHQLTEREIKYSEPFKNGSVGLFDWVQYFVFCGSIAFGMAIEYKDFNDWINLRA